jgi:hypothetical protein
VLNSLSRLLPPGFQPPDLQQPESLRLHSTRATNILLLQPPPKVQRRQLVLNTKEWVKKLEKSLSLTACRAVGTGTAAAARDTAEKRFVVAAAVVGSARFALVAAVADTDIVQPAGLTVWESQLRREDHGLGHTTS